MRDRTTAPDPDADRTDDGRRTAPQGPAGKTTGKKASTKKKTTKKAATKKASAKKKSTKKAASKKATAKKATAKKAAKASAKKKVAKKAAVRRAAGQAWLVKTEPDVYSIDDLARDGKTMWDGVRNYQARNLMRDEMRVGDPVLIYHSNADPMAIVGLGSVASESYPDPTAFDRKDKHFDPKSKSDEPTWYLVDIAHTETFPVPLEREFLKEQKALDGMMLLARGSRLSVQPVKPAELKAVLALARKRAK